MASSGATKKIAATKKGTGAPDLDDFVAFMVAQLPLRCRPMSERFADLKNADFALTEVSMRAEGCAPLSLKFMVDLPSIGEKKQAVEFTNPTTALRRALKNGGSADAESGNINGWKHVEAKAMTPGDHTAAWRPLGSLIGPEMRVAPKKGDDGKKASRKRAVAPAKKPAKKAKRTAVAASPSGSDDGDDDDDGDDGEASPASSDDAPEPPPRKKTAAPTKKKAASKRPAPAASKPSAKKARTAPPAKSAATKRKDPAPVVAAPKKRTKSAAADDDAPAPSARPKIRRLMPAKVKAYLDAASMIAITHEDQYDDQSAKLKLAELRMVMTMDTDQLRRLAPHIDRIRTAPVSAPSSPSRQADQNGEAQGTKRRSDDEVELERPKRKRASPSPVAAAKPSINDLPVMIDPDTMVVGSRPAPSSPGIDAAKDEPEPSRSQPPSPVQAAQDMPDPTPPVTPDPADDLTVASAKSDEDAPTATP